MSTVTDERFLRAVEVVLGHEGGYVNDPRDLGGETKYGISKRSYPQEDIKNLTKERAMEIYYRDWWQRYTYGEIVDLAVATKVFDLSVNMGPSAAHKLLQKALNWLDGAGLVVDGVLGPLTIKAANEADPARLIQALRYMAAERYFELVKARPENKAFLLGWLNRAYS